MRQFPRIFWSLMILTWIPNAIASPRFRTDHIDRAKRDRAELQWKILQSTREIETISKNKKILEVRYAILYKARHGPNETIENYFRFVSDLIITCKSIIALAEEDKRCGDEKLPQWSNSFMEEEFESVDPAVFEAQLHYAVGVEKLTGRNGVHVNLEEMRSKLAEIQALIDESETTKPRSP